MISVLSICTLSLSINIDSNVFANDIAKTCEYDSESKVNPDFSTMNCLLTETALKYDVPPEIVKAIAEGESGNWRHFNENGEAIITADNGIGIMQITNQAGYDLNKLKSNLVYNIEAGVQILNSMYERKDLPFINGGERDVLEHWYFAIMAYNGIKPVNSPIVQATGERNAKAYQEKILRLMEDYALIDIVDLPFSREDFDYDTNSSQNIKFTVMNYDLDLPLTKSKHLFDTNQKVKAITNVNIRTNPTSGSQSKGTLSKDEIVTITGPFKFDEDSTKKNHFVWYPVKTSDGTEGYVVSSYLDYSTSTLTFKDVPANHYAKVAIDYLDKRDILEGWVEQDKFGLGDDLTRLQAALLLNRAKDVSTKNRPDPGLVDVPKDSPHYEAIAAAVDEGFFKGTPEKKFEPNKILTRAEMATVFQRIYKFPAPSSSHPFTDVKNEWFADSVARLYASGITDGVTDTKFDPNGIIKKEQFVLFLVRSMDENYRLKKDTKK